MATAREIHRHMKSVKNIGQITTAMKMVAGTARSMGITVKGEFPVNN